MDFKDLPDIVLPFNDRSSDIYAVALFGRVLAVVVRPMGRYPEDRRRRIESATHRAGALMDSSPNRLKTQMLDLQSDWEHARQLLLAAKEVDEIEMRDVFTMGDLVLKTFPGEYVNVDDPFDERSDEGYALALLREVGYIVSQPYASDDLDAQVDDAIHKAVDLGSVSLDRLKRAMLRRQDEWEKARTVLRAILKSGAVTTDDTRAMKVLILATFMEEE